MNNSIENSLRVLCVYCGEYDGVEREHVVGKQFFSPMPSNDKLILAPACRKCNQAIAFDEDYVRLKIVWDIHVSKHPAAQELLGIGGKDGKVARAIRRRPPIQEMMRQDFKYRDMRMLSGIVVPDQLTLDIDPERLHNVIRKITRGLYYHEFKSIFPNNGEIVILYLSDEVVTDAQWQPILTVAKALLPETQVPGPRRLGRGEFSYAYRQLSVDNQTSSIWLMSFYDGMYFTVNMNSRLGQ